MAKRTVSRESFSKKPAASLAEREGARQALTSLESASIGTLLARCLQLAETHAKRRALHALSSDAWAALVTEAERHGVGPLLHHRLGQVEGLGIDHAAARRLRDVYTYSHLRSVAVNDRLGSLSTSAAVLGIPVIPLKGADLAIHVYAEPALRPMNDLDILVRRCDAERLRTAVLALDYREMRGVEEIDYSRHHHLKPLTRLGEVQVEVHHALVPRDAPFDIDMSGLWERSILERAGGTQRRRLAPDDLLLHLCTHAAYNDQFRISLLSVCDIDSTVRRYADSLDWSRLVSTANADGRSRFVYASLRLAQELLATPVRADALDDLRHDVKDRDVVQAVGEFVLSSAADVPDGVKALDGVEGVGSRLLVILRSTFPSRARLRHIYELDAGAKTVGLYYLLRPIDLLWRRSRNVIGILVRTASTRPAVAREHLRRRISRWVAGW